MSRFERIRMGAGVVFAGLVLVLSTSAAHDGRQIFPEKTSARDIESVRRGVAILERGRSPIIGLQPCDAVKSLLPERFTREDGDRKITESNGTDVILCFRDSIDYRDGQAAAITRRLNWAGGLGGDRIVAFAPSEARFLEVARLNGLTIRPSDLYDADPLLFRLLPHARAFKVKDGWSIPPGEGADEALYGPYTTRPPGRYRLQVGFEPETNIPCSAAILAIRVQIAVTANARSVQLVPRQPLALKPLAPAAGHCVMTAAIEFSIATPAGGIETPIWVRSGVLPVRLTQYALERIGQP